MTTGEWAVILTTLCCCGGVGLLLLVFLYNYNRERRPPWNGPNW